MGKQSYRDKKELKKGEEEKRGREGNECRREGIYKETDKGEPTC